jgi:tetratricopeptide (TPR) repeat protein
VRRLGPLVAVLLAGLLSACGGSSRHAPVVENPYDEAARSFAELGVTAMQRERWDAAEHSFERELAAAQLADDAPAVVLARYNLGMARLAAGKREPGRRELEMAQGLAQRYGFDVMVARARLALALDRARAGKVDDLPDVDVQASWPADVQLSAGRLALYRRDISGAQQAYARALHQASTDRSGIVLQAKAHLGLAMAARAAGDAAAVRSELQQTLKLCRQAGAPRVAADALTMLAATGGPTDGRLDALERALAIYRYLQDAAAQRRALSALIALTTGDVRTHWQQQLDGLGTNPAVTP